MDKITKEPMNLKDFLEEADLLQYFQLFRDTLKVTKLSQLKFVVNDDLTQIGMSKPEQRQYKKLYTKYFPNNYFSKIRKLLGTNKKNDLGSQEQDLNIDSMQVLPFSENDVKVPTKHIIPVEDISINKELGMGQFGVVQQGTWTTGNQRVQVAIKCLGHERMTSNSTEFLKEAAVMHSIEHPSIVRLYGVVLHLDSLMLVTELAPLRSLLECLREIPLRPNFPVPTLCDFAEQICDGMTYLENKRLIHRDLAARNILVFNKDKVKISDFGLSRALGVGKDYYQTNYNVNLKLPVAWCAPECILYLRFTSASDVWAFGVCLWEMFTYGFQPWAAFSGQQILEAIDAPNFQRLEKPECCPDAYYTTMLECWSHDPQNRPKFKALGMKLQEIRPEQAQATANSIKFNDARRSNYLEYKTGQIITILGKENVTKMTMWYGVLPDGACGYFDPNTTQPYTYQRTSSLTFRLSACQSPKLSRSSVRLSGSLRPSMLRSDTKRHTYTGRRTIERSMISSPQGEVKHTGHIGLDGAYFGDLSFLDPTICPPRQVVTPYKPSEDLEQMPLINPNSPSHLTGGVTSTPPYPLLSKCVAVQLKEPTIVPKQDNDNVPSSTGAVKKNGNHNTNLRVNTELTTSKTLPGKLKSSSLGRSNKSSIQPKVTAPKDTEPHEYQEITDQNGFQDNRLPEYARSVFNPDSPTTPKTTEFTQDLLQEIESIFGNVAPKPRRDSEHPNMGRQNSDESRYQTLGSHDKRKTFTTGTMKAMSAHDEKTLNTAVALANEITTRSMNDLAKETPKLPNSPSDKNKFHFKFPLVTSLSQPSTEIEKDMQAKQERRNFSEEANRVPDIQSSFTKESKLAYTSLIENPTITTSLIPHLGKAKSLPKTASRPESAPPVPDRPKISLYEDDVDHGLVKIAKFDQTVKINAIPLPPKSNKPRLVDKPRHIRKYPLLMPNDHHLKQKATEEKCKTNESKTNIYQNCCHIHVVKVEINERKPSSPKHKVQYLNLLSADVVDGTLAIAMEKATPKYNPGTPKSPNAIANPFNEPSPSSSVANPFKGTKDDSIKNHNEDGIVKENNDSEKGKLFKDCTDHVSVEDLLEFADQKPCGRQRGIESDEVRIMCKVLKHQATPNDCLDALEISDWNVHQAIKIMRVMTAVGTDTNLEECSKELNNYNGDILKASTVLAVKYKKKE